MSLNKDIYSDIRDYLELDLFDYMNNKICTLYNSKVDMSGQATDVNLTIDRNGWKELKISLPWKCFDGEKTVDNFRIKALQPDYKVRLIDDNGIDWFIVNNHAVKHTGFNKTLNVTMGHGSQFLKYKNLSLVFSDDEGNNIGTPRELLEEILKGTGWIPGNIDEFYEKDGVTIKRRSLVCSEKTGSFKMISSMCNLFDAKPIYRYEERTADDGTKYWQGIVDIIPLNPFSENLDGTLKDVEKADGVIEIHYGINVSDITKTMDSENIATKLYAYGAYGDKTHGYCSIQECMHKEYMITVNDNLSKGDIYSMLLPNVEGNIVRQYFRAPYDISANSSFIFSTLDPMSLSYLWDVNKEYAIMLLGRKPEDEEIIFKSHAKEISYKYEIEEVQNWFAYLMDFDYYIQNGLLSDEMFQNIAKFQRYSLSEYTSIYDANKKLADKKLELNKLIGLSNYGKLNVKSIKTNTDPNAKTSYIKLELHDEPFIYRTDADKKNTEKFRVIGNDHYDYNGDPIVDTYSEYPSVVYIVRKQSGEDVFWKKIYVREATWIEDGYSEGEIKYDKTHPLDITLNIANSEIELNINDYDFYLFAINNTSGFIGALESTDEAALQSLEKSTTIITSRHPVFWDKNISEEEAELYKYCWKWDSEKSELYYFSVTDPSNKTNGWKSVHLARSVRDETDPTVYKYRYDCQTAKLYRTKTSTAEDGTVIYDWINLDSEALRKEIRDFGTVYMICMQRERLYNGTYKNNIYTVGENGLTVGDYYIDSGYDYYYVFSLKKNITEGATINYCTGDGFSTSFIEVKNPYNAEEDDSLAVKIYRFDSVSRSENDWLSSDEKVYEYTSNGKTEIYNKAGAWYKLSSDSEYDYMLTVEGAEYEFDGVKQYVGGLTAGKYYLETDDTVYLFETATDYKYKTTLNFNLTGPSIKIVDPTGKTTTIEGRLRIISVPKDSKDLKDSYHDRIDHYDNTIYISDIPYTKLSPITHEVDGVEEKHGLITYMTDFVALTIDVYENLDPQVKEAQSNIESVETKMRNSLGDLYREGWWQDTNYVDGDEQRLYDDAIENIVEISKPKETYNISYVDNYGSRSVVNAYGDKNDIYPYKNPSIMTAAHIIDVDTGINKWAFIDKITRNYTNRGKTTLVFNTSLKAISQHNFTDVMSTIAQVANEYKGSAAKINSAVKASIDTRAYNIEAIVEEIVSNPTFMAKFSQNIVQSDQVEETPVSNVDEVITALKDKNALDDSIKVIVRNAVTPIANEVAVNLQAFDTYSAKTNDKISIMDQSLRNVKNTATAVASKVISSADIDYSQVMIEAEEGLWDNLIVRDQANLDKVYIDRLKVNNAQLVSATVGELIIKASDDKYYRLDIDANGAITPVDVTVTLEDTELTAGVTADGHSTIIETDLTVTDLATDSFRSTNALIDKITADRIDVNTLVAKEAFIGALETSRIFSKDGVIKLVAEEAVNDAIADKPTIYRDEDEPSASDSSVGSLWIKSSTGQTYQLTNGVDGKEWILVTDTDQLSKITEEIESTVADAISEMPTIYRQEFQPSTLTSTIGSLWIKPSTGQIHQLTVVDSINKWMQITDAEQVSQITAAVATAEAAKTAADKKIETYALPSTSTPSNPNTGDLWIQTDQGNKLFRYNGSEWVVIQDESILTAQLDVDSLKQYVEIRPTGLYIKDENQISTMRLTSGAVQIGDEGRGGYARFDRDSLTFGNYDLRMSTDGGLVFKIKE